MKKSAQYLLMLPALLALLTACQPDQGLPGKGWLVLDDLNFGEDEEVRLVTRAVESDLNIEILDADNAVVASFAAGQAAAGLKIELEAGGYTLRAYTSNVNTVYSNSQPGAPKYDGNKAFTILEDRICYVGLTVPMVNTGVRLDQAGADLSEFFKGFTLTVIYHGRTFSLNRGQTAYFDMGTPTEEATWIFTATNQDDEDMSSSGTFLPQAGTVYTLSYTLE